MNAHSEVETPLWSHLDGLREVLIRCLIAVAIAFAVTLFFYEELFSLITWPLQQTETTTHSGFHTTKVNHQRIYNFNSEERLFKLPNESSIISSSSKIRQISSHEYLIAPGASFDVEKTNALQNLVILSPIEGMTTTLKISFWAAVVISSPCWLYCILQFVLPALRTPEKALLFPFLGLSAVFLCLGVLFGYHVTLPLSNAFLWSFNENLGHNMWTLSNYLDFTFFLLVANALAFELSLLLFFIVHLGVITPQWMKIHRKHMIIASLILGALLTPPDIFSQLTLALPLMGLYEMAILYAVLLQKQTPEDKKKAY